MIYKYKYYRGTESAHELILTDLNLLNTKGFERKKIQNTKQHKIQIYLKATWKPENLTFRHYFHKRLGRPIWIGFQTKKHDIAWHRWKRQQQNRHIDPENVGQVKQQHSPTLFLGRKKSKIITNIHSLKQTGNSSPLKMVVSNRNVLFQGSIFTDYVSFREGTQFLGPLTQNHLFW